MDNDYDPDGNTTEAGPDAQGHFFSPTKGSEPSHFPIKMIC